MKILHILYDNMENPWVGGGGAVRSSKIYAYLAKKGHEVTILSGKFPGARDKTIDGINYRFIGNAKNYVWSTFSFALKAKEFLRENIENYDVVIEDFAPWNPVFAYKYQDIKPVVIQLHHKEGSNILKKYYIFGLPFWILERFYPRKYKNVISVSETTLTKYGLKGVVIPNGVEGLEMVGRNKSAGDYILFIGRIDLYNKGLDILVKANLDFPVLIAGKGKDEKKLLSKLPPNYKFLGFVDDKKKSDLIKNARILVMPSRFEGQGIVALEAAAFGVPLVVSDIPELRYVVEKGFGISFKKGDINDFKNKVKFLYNNDKLVEKLGNQGTLFVQNHTWGKIAEDYEKYLLETIQNFKNGYGNEKGLYHHP